MKKIFVCIGLFVASLAGAQTTYLMNNTAVSLSCPSTSLFYDSGGSAGAYGFNENFMKTFTAPAGNCLTVTFKNIDIEACCDILNIHDGPNTLAPLLGSLAMTSAGPVTYVTTGNSLSFGFASDFSVNGAGWQATITCVSSACSGSPAPGTISLSTSTAGCASSGPATLTCAGGAVSCGLTFQWQSATSSTGPWTNISGATNPTSASVSYLGKTYFRKQVCCGATCAYSNTLALGTGTSGAGCDLSTYSSASITYSFDTFTGTTCPSTDDVLYSSIAMMGFQFCYTGAAYWGGYIASNAAFVFAAVPCFPNISVNTNAGPGVYTGYEINAPAPSDVSSFSQTIPLNAVLGPYHDIDPSVAGGTIRYGTLGTAPNRRFVISYETVPMFSCNAKNFTAQIKLFETSNNIEIHVGKKVVCAGWNNGEAVLGLHSYDGLTYVGAVNSTMHNSTGISPYNQWTMTTQAYRFTSPCATSGACAVLPVNFKKFYGERKDKVNHVYWETAMEENVKYFGIERSSNAVDFVEIGKADPHNAASKYEFDDNSTMPGSMNYYRIVSHDKDGAHNRTNTIVMGAKEGEIAVSGIYPNPVQSEFTMSVESAIITTVNITIYDAFGKLVKVFTKDISIGISQINLNGEDIPQGIYFIETTNLNKEVVAKQKMVKINQ